jgi:hypothetical protein
VEVVHIALLYCIVQVSLNLDALTFCLLAPLSLLQIQADTSRLYHDVSVGTADSKRLGVREKPRIG